MERNGEEPLGKSQHATTLNAYESQKNDLTKVTRARIETRRKSKRQNGATTANGKSPQKETLSASQRVTALTGKEPQKELLHMHTRHCTSETEKLDGSRPTRR